MRLVFLLFFGFLASVACHSQHLLFRELANDIALPSHECYNVMQDSKGYIWIGTENGLCRYNGSELKVFNKKNGLPEKGVYSVKENRDGSFQLLSAAGRILRLKDDSISEEAYSKNFRRYRNSVNTVPYHVAKAGNEYIINTMSFSYRADPATGQVTELTKDRFDRQNNTMDIYMDPAQPYFIRRFKFMAPVPGGADTYIQAKLIKGDKEKVITLPYTAIVLTERRIEICMVDSILFFSYGYKLVRVGPDFSVKTFDLKNRILCLAGDQTKGLWVGLFENGYMHYADVETMQQPETGLDDYSVSGICADKEGGLWCSTLEKGIFYSANRYLYSYNNVPGLHKIATLLKPVGDSLFVSTQSDNLMVIRGQRIHSIRIPIPTSGGYTDILPHGRHWYIANRGFSLRTDQGLKQHHSFRDARTHHDFASCQIDTNQNQVYYATHSRLMHEVGDSLISITGPFNISFKRILFCEPGKALLSNGDGLYEVSTNTRTWKKVKGLHTDIGRLTKASDGTIWIATKGDGLWMRKAGVYSKFRLNGSVAHPVIYDVKEDREGNLWLGSENGLICLTLKNGQSMVKEYTVASGLPSNDIRDLAIIGNELYFSVSSGLHRVAINQIGNASKPALYVQSILVNDLGYHGKTNNLVLAHNQNSLRIRFDVLTYKPEQKEALLYRLSGPNAVFQRSPLRELSFEHLSAGEYTLTVYGLNNNGLKSEIPVVISFEIQKPFWQRARFILACLVVAAALLFLITRQIIRRIRQKEKERTRINKLIAETQLSAIQAQMNPHFIFNAINSIQNYIVKHEQEEAFNYLVQFSKLIRMVLNNSSEIFLPLETEIETLKLYVSLEKMRFNNFDVEFYIDEAVDVYTFQVPSMLIQPYVENAIWHGLMPLGDKRKARLRIELFMEDTFLVVHIRDNGIGREQAKLHRQNSVHRSMGMKLSEQRLEAINKMEWLKGMQVRIEDLYNADGTASGTHVELKIPMVEDNDEN